MIRSGPRSFSFCSAYLVHHCLGVFFSSAFCIPNVICALSYGPLSLSSSVSLFSFYLLIQKKSCCDGDPGLGTRRGNRERGLDRSPFFSSVSRLALTVYSALDEVVFTPPALPFALPCPLYA